MCVCIYVSKYLIFQTTAVLGYLPKLRRSLGLAFGG